MKPIPWVSTAIIESDFAQLERIGVVYGYGEKAAANAPIGSFHSIDCSGYSFWALARASKGALLLPGGSQNQLAFCEDNFPRVNYIQSARYMTEKRLFIHFIKPFTNGCGKVGHVWFTSQFNDGNNGTNVGTLESHGGGGINSRPWNYPTLLREHYASFELPTV